MALLRITCMTLPGCLWLLPLRFVQSAVYLFQDRLIISWLSQSLDLSVVRQIYGDGAASPKDCFKMFNPTDISTYNVSPVLNFVSLLLSAQNRIKLKDLVHTPWLIGNE